MTAIRATILLLLSILVGLGWIPAEVQGLIEANIDAVLSGGLALWAIIAGVRAWGERRSQRRAANTAR